ncbi:9086_t:CDS:2 [Acaulospora colombiana]|uniref:9086_t:CDS:1 n=1 Tax=Acaulospora colombiana TaxID=27376 RepID=A0ACA9MJ13_9GLOM|nr:9086_t:CDS:2 [Acaulospora colombiana]
MAIKMSIDYERDHQFHSRKPLAKTRHVYYVMNISMRAIQSPLNLAASSADTLLLVEPAESMTRQRQGRNLVSHEARYDPRLFFNRTYDYQRFTLRGDALFVT